ncbi:rRNA maturation RNase YbeY [Desulforegula conservatrix]|uniref:rRNA maturation RNase YbeY n=1 Tax=Desulforegula conservatrix TaxID=153026 RepID=UPI000413A15F|nr:rRNA maturation RNase YbeY [Desulforegula conservatrix]
MGYPDAELSISIVDDTEIRNLNRDYRGKDKATNVLSFAMNEGDFDSINPEILGDVVISADTTQTESAEYGMSFDDRLFQLLIHGVLHLVGYDHEQGDEESAIMEKKSDEIMSKVFPETVVKGWIG